MADIQETIGKYAVKPSNNVNRLAIILWGKSGAGKTTFAATSEGDKLIINFDPDGYTSLSNRSDVSVIDLSTERPETIDALREGDTLRLEDYLKKNPSIKTVIIDSMTTLADVVMKRAVSRVTSMGYKNISQENPGMTSYGVRNLFTLAIVNNLMAITKRCDCHFIAICHEEADKVEEGQQQTYSPNFGGKLSNQIPLLFSEIWHLADNKTGRVLSIRPSNGRTLAKSRMFDTTGAASCALSYNANDDTGVKIATLFDTWRKQGFLKKLAFPI